MKIEKQVQGIIEAIKGRDVSALHEEAMDGLEARRAELTASLSDVPDDTPDIPPSVDLEQRTLQTIDNPFGTRLSPMA